MWGITLYEQQQSICLQRLPGTAGGKKMGTAAPGLWKLSTFMPAPAPSRAGAYSGMTVQLQSQWADVETQAWKWKKEKEMETQLKAGREQRVLSKQQNETPANQKKQHEYSLLNRIVIYLLLFSIVPVASWCRIL